MANKKLDFDGLKQQLHADIEGTVRNWLPGGRKEVHEYVVENPTRDDHKKGSFKINLRTGKWQDFATGDTGGDLISLYGYLKGVKNGEAYKLLTGNTGEGLEVKKRSSGPAKPVVPEEEYTRLTLPEDAPEMPAVRGKAERVALYHDERGRVVMRVAIFRDKATGRKTPVPTSWGKLVTPKMRENEKGEEKWTGEMNERTGWHKKAWPANRPLYNLHHLHQRPNAPVVFGEGEKVAARLEMALGDTYVCMTWASGAKAVGKSDFRTVVGRDVVLCPDYDLPGQKAMLEVGRILKQQNCKVRMVWQPLDEDLHTDGWDLADEPDDGKVVEAVAGAVSLETVENLIAEKLKMDEGKPGYADASGGLEDVLPIMELRNQNDLRCLGYGRNNRVYMISRRRGVVVEMKPSDLGNTSELFSLMPAKFWYKLFPNRKGDIEKNLCMDTMQRWADETGFFNPDVVRGCGVWREADGSFIFHMGQHLLVKGEAVPISEFKSEFMYEATQNLGLKLCEPAKTEDTRKILELASFPDWDLPVYGQLLAGFCVIAPVCGGLAWRPHIWVTGASGSGKSTVMINIIKRLCGKTCLHAKGETTAPGLRQRMGSDARPVLFDEFEGETPQRLLEVQNVINLARIASSDDDAKIYKGGAQGEAIEFSFRSCMAFTGINVNMTHYADKSRITLLTLKEAPQLPEADQERRDEAFKQWEALLEKELTPAFVNALHMRAYGLLPVIRASAKVFAEAIAPKLRSRRLGDQLGILCAGAWALQSAEVVSKEQAVAWVAQYDFERVAPMDELKDHDRGLAHIMQSMVKLQTERGAVDRTLGELVGVVAMRNPTNTDSITEANRVLLRHGLRVYPEYNTMALANNNMHLERILKGTPYVNWRTLLARIPGVTPGKKQIRFGDAGTHRALMIPLNILVQTLPQPDDKNPGAAPPPPEPPPAATRGQVAEF